MCSYCGCDSIEVIGRFMAEHLGAGLAVLQRVKDALDPQGIMNPGKLGLASSIDEGTLWP